MKYLRPSSFLLLSLLMLAFAFQAAAQEATIAGTVTDPSGSAIPGAKVTITNNDTAATRQVVSNDAGQYNAPSLGIGKYTVKVEAAGFKSAEQNDIVLNVGAHARVDVQLKIGESKETVTVEGVATRIQSDSSEVSEIVTGQQMTQLATNGRNLVNLATLTPGVSSTVSDFNGPSAQGSGFTISFNGQRPDHNVWMVDGGENYDRGSGGKFNIMPSIDAVAEFRALTSNYSADYGLNSGATLSLVFKGGTKDFHGGAWEFFRNDKLDAGNYFTNAAGAKPPELRYNVFGFNIGGPVILPFYNKDRNKTFFFANIEWRRYIAGGSNTVQTPNAAMEGGVFPSTITVPTAVDATELARFTSLGLTPGKAFPNNTIPSSLISPLSKAILGLGIYPTPNTTSGGFPAFTGGANAPTYVGEQIMRIDHHFNDKFWIFGHYVWEQLSQTYGTTLWSGSNLPTVGDVFANPSWSGVVHGTYTISPTIVNEVAFNYGANNINVTPTGIFQRSSAVDPPQLFPSNAMNRLPGINISSGLSDNYDSANYPWANTYRSYQLREDLSWTHGHHSLKFGGQYMFNIKTQELFGDTQGAYAFNGSYTGAGFADFLLGYAATYNELAVQDSGNWHSQTYALYGQDDWRATNRLTLNLGLRWEGIPHTYELNNRMSNFYPQLYNQANAAILLPNGNVSPNSPGLAPGLGAASVLQLYQNGIAITGQNGAPRDIVQNHWNNWGPRIGFAYDVTGQGKTVVRGGFAIMYERVQGNDVYNMGPNAPFSASPTVSNVFLSNPLQSVLTGQTASAPITTTAITGESQYNYKNPTTYQWSMGVQHEVWHGAVLQASYVGNVGTHQSEAIDINAPFNVAGNLAQRQQVIAGTLNVDLIRPYPGFGQILMYDDGGRSKYNALQTEFRMQATRGLTVQFAYTYSHTYDTSTGLAVNGNAGDLDTLSNPYNRAYDWGLSSYDRPNVFIADYVWDIPLFQHASSALKTVAGGWKLSGVVTAESGVAYTETLPGNTLGMGGNVTNRPDLSGSISYPKTVTQWFNPAAFTTPTSGSFGSEGKGSIRGPGRQNWDVSLFKDFTVKEKATLELRFETFNTFNHTQFNGLNVGYGSGAGAITSAFDPRTIQLGAKFLF
ncbi:MAG TPA: TonB-dependent receptor [Bryobacteraceae bacterium]|nr:TonB-dependent receptor [Bryobacteraceae bacterium]